jgi:uncharacterized protein YceK
MKTDNRFETYRRQTALVQDSRSPCLGLFLRDGDFSYPRRPAYPQGCTSIGWKVKAMKSDAGRWAVVALLSAAMCGCSSIRARNEIPNEEWTVYPGSRKDVKEMGEIFKGERTEPGWVKGLITTILIVDLPISTVFDTVIAPYDVYRIYNPEDFEKARGSSESPPDQEAEGQEAE